MHDALQFSAADYIRLYAVLFFTLCVLCGVLFLLKKKFGATHKKLDGKIVGVASKGRVDYGLDYYVILVGDEKFLVLKSVHALAIEKIKNTGD